MPADAVRPRLLALPPLPPEALRAMLASVDVEVVVPAERTDAEVRRLLPDVDLVLGDWSHTLGLKAPEADLVRGGRLRFVQQPSVGTDVHDPAALAEVGVPLANTAGANADAVAEWCVGATLSLLRSLTWADGQIRAGGWPQLDVVRRGSAQLGGKRVGVLGHGAIGQRVAQLCAAFGSEVVFHTRAPRPGDPAYRSLEDLLAMADVLVLVLPSTPQTRGLLDAAALDRLPAGALVVNAARGGIVDEVEVAARCADGRLGGAAFDVYAVEPLAADSPLRASDRILLSPHAAGSTREATTAVINRSLENLNRFCAGEQPVDVVNGVPVRFG